MENGSPIREYNVFYFEIILALFVHNMAEENTIGHNDVGH
jgi:hypothetical protein